MAVEIKGNSDLAVSKPFAGNLRVDARREHVGRVRVPQTVKPYLAALCLHEGAYRVRYRVRLQRASISLSDNMVIRTETDTEMQEVLRLLRPMPSQLRISWAARLEVGR